MSAHRRYSRRRGNNIEIDDDVPGSNRRLKRPYDSLPMMRSPASHHGWVLLNRASARWDDFPGDRRTSAAISRTSKGDEISVAFEFVEPPNTSFLTADLPQSSTTTPTIIAVHRDVVLLAVTSSYGNTYPPNTVFDLFVYQASRPPSLLLLPSAGSPVIDYTKCLGIMSCTSNDDDSSPPFVVSYLQMRSGVVATIDAYLFRSQSGQWEAFKNLCVVGANDGRESLLRWWRTDEVVPYGRRYMIWVDYYRGMVIMELSSQSEMTTMKPKLQYVRLPVDRVGDHVGLEFGGRGCPKDSRRMFVTRYGIKFVSVDRQHRSNFGIGHQHTLTWSHRFRIITWSLCEDDYTWRNDVVMHEETFWDTFDGGDRYPFPHVQPRFPVVNVDNPDIVAFRLEESVATWPKWMIEADLRKKVLLAATNCSKQESDDAEDISFVIMKSGFDPIPSELPRYLDGCEQARKKRRH